jgi:ribosomal protein L3 glutamine methyltransferase
MSPADETRAPDELLTVRDWLRFATSAFTKARLVYGHGTATALDEAAFIILSTLHLPVDSLEPWLDCRLTRDEREHVYKLISARVSTRKPAPYLTNSAWIQGHKFYVDERVIVPRSFIGELLCGNSLSSAIGDPERVARVLELCTGSGCLAILAAEAFPNAVIDATDISQDALDVARRNIDDYGLHKRIHLHRGDLFEGLAAASYDVIIANPPYVTADAVNAFPPEYRAEPSLAHLGGHDGMDLVHRILAKADSFLSPAGALIVEIGNGQRALEGARPDLPFLWLDTDTSEGEVFALTAAELAPASAKPKPAIKGKRR